MTTLKDVHLVVVYEPPFSLAASVRGGFFEREMALFRKLRPHVKDLTLVSHGISDLADHGGAIEGINVCCNEKGWPGWLFRLWLAYGFARGLPGKVIIRTDQMLAGGISLRMAKQVKGWFVARCGYMASDNAARRNGGRARETKRVINIEKNAFPYADRIIVSTPEIKNRIVDLYSIPSEQITVVPNYVDTRVMASAKKPKSAQKRICFIGRLEEEKNPLNLVKAVKGTGAHLVVVGRGPLRQPMEILASELNISVEFLDIVPYLDLPAILNSCDVFVLPSLYEGHPKALLEAMSCGLPVIGAESPGIREVIAHEKTGYLCGTDAESIRSAIKTVLGNPELAARMGQNAETYIRDTVELDKVVAKELEVLKALVETP